MKSNPSDRKILQYIYDQYYNAFRSFKMDDPEHIRSSKIYVPIDITSIAAHFDVDPDIIFGRLYYHLDKRFGYKQTDRSSVSFFTRVAGNDRNAVHFPLLSAVLAEQTEAKNRFVIPIIISVISLVISVFNVLFTLAAFK